MIIRRITERSKLELTVHLEEYKAMRSEILEHLKFQANALTFGTSVLAAVSAALAAVYSRSTPENPQTLLICFLLAGMPPIAFLFGMWMVHKESMVAELAIYIHLSLKPKLEAIVGPSELLCWDVERTNRTYATKIQKSPRVLSVFGHAFFGLFIAASTLFAWYSAPADLDTNFIGPLSILVVVDFVLLGIFVLSASAVARLHHVFSSIEKTSILDLPINKLLPEIQKRRNVRRGSNTANENPALESMAQVKGGK